MHYQPKFALATKQLVGFEALVRWQHSELGTVSPALFIPLAESCGLIHALGLWVLQHSCRQFSSWLAQGCAPFSLAVNVSAHQFGKDQLLDELRQAKGLPMQTAFIMVTGEARYQHVAEAVEGALDEVIDPLQQEWQAEQLASLD
mgnify:CR=1 FL=1